MTAAQHMAAPVRLDFAGGWTDVPPYSAREGGVVVAAAIQLFARARIEPRARGYRLVSRDIGATLRLAGDGDLAAREPLPLHRAGLRMLPVGPCTLTTSSDAPPGSGLGSSGALDVAIVAALAAARGERPDLRTIADLACRLESVEAGIPGGRQDQFVAAYGGFLRLEFHDPEARAVPLHLDPAFASELERRTLLCYTGASRFSGATIARVMLAYERGEPTIAGALDGLRGVAERTVEALRSGDLARLGELLSENWRLQRLLDPGMSTPAMERLDRAMRAAGVLGGKASGAGAGGSMFFLGPDDPRPAAQAANSLGMRLLPVRWSISGVRKC